MKTKNIIAILAALPVVAFFTACSSDEEKEAKPAKETLIVVGGSVQQYAADEQRAEFMVQADCRWTINEADINYGDFSRDELIISPHQGNGNGTITITSMKNTDTKAREATFVIVSDGGLKQKITIQQNKAADNLIVSVEALDYLAKPNASENLEKKFSIYSNGNWQITGMPSWLHLDVTSGGQGTYEITAVCDEAMDDAGRNAQLTVSSGTQTPQFITVKQEGMDINDIYLLVTNTQQESEVYFSASGDEAVVRVESNAEWHVTVTDSWFTLSQTEGMGDGEIRVSCAGNANSAYERLATLIIYAGTKTPVQRELRLRQGSAQYPALGNLSISSSDIGTTSATLSFELSSISEGYGIERFGICYSHDNQVPTVENATIDGTLTNVSITGLDEKTTYYVRAYAISAAYPQQVVYSRNVVTFTTGSSIVIPGNNDNPNPTPAPALR